MYSCRWWRRWRLLAVAVILLLVRFAASSSLQQCPLLFVHQRPIVRSRADGARRASGAARHRLLQNNKACFSCRFVVPRPKRSVSRLCLSAAKAASSNQTDGDGDALTGRIVSDDGDEEQHYAFTINDDETEEPTTIDDVPLALPLSLDQLSETFATNVSYFYLKNELNLSDTAMWRITYGASSALAMSTDVVRHKVNVLRETMELSDEHVRTILERFPAILHLSADKNLAPTILFLLRALDLGRDELRELVVTCPALLSYSRANLKSKFDFFRRIMKYSVKECRELFLEEPRILGSSVKTGLIPHLQFLLRDIEIPMDQLRLIVKKNPRILFYSLEQNLIPKLVYHFLMKLHMSTRQVTKLLLAFPQILDFNLDRTIQPKTHYFIKDLGFSNTEFACILLRYPRLYSLSLRNIKHSVGYLRFELRLSSSQVKQVLYRAPKLLSLNAEENVKDKFSYLQKTLGLSDDQTRLLVAAMPSLLGLNIERNLQHKLDYLKSSFGAESILRDSVLRCPSLLGYSLDNRIKPRVEAIIDAGLDPSSITVGIPKKQAAFETWLQSRKAAAIRKRLEAQKAAPVPPAPPTSVTPADASGRIVHWSRERRPRPDV